MYLWGVFTSNKNMKKLLLSLAVMTAEESTSIIYVTVGKTADAKPEFTEVVR